MKGGAPRLITSGADESRLYGRWDEELFEN
jgi:hypothetical protein